MIPSHSNKRMAKHKPTCHPQSQLKGFRVRLDFAEKDFIELDQWPSRCSSLRTDPSYKASLPRTIFTPFPDEVAHKTSSLHNTEKPVIANHFEIGLISLGITVVFEWRRNNFLSINPASWNVLLQEEPDKKMMFAKYQRSSSILQNCRKIVLKNSVNPGWVKPDLNYIL